MIRLNTLRAVLAERGLVQWKLARKLGFQPSTFSDYLRGARNAPDGLGRRIEEALGLSPGVLSGRKVGQP